MPYEWEPGVYYDYESIVFFQGVQYKIVQPHQSEPGWEPPATPALWARIEGGYGGFNDSYQQPQYDRGYEQPPPPPQPDCGEYQAEKRWDEHEEQQVQIHEEERERHWWDLDEKRKHELEIGGGLLAGVALIGGGYYAYHAHNKSEEQKKAQTWGLQNWIQDARARTEVFYREGPKGPTTWVLVEGKNIPDGAITGGEEEGEPQYICRAFFEGGVQVGRASPRLAKGAVIGHGHQEIDVGTYEILLGDQRAVRWVDAYGPCSPQALGCRPVEGGWEADKRPLFIAHVRHHGAVLPGKAAEHLNGAMYTYGGREHEMNEYRVLCYA